MLLSPLALYNHDSHLFDDLSVPTGIDKTELINYTLVQTAELECLYADPATFKLVLKAWTTARLGAWTRIVTALNNNYDPLHNYDRTESETISRDLTKETTGETSSSSTGSVTDQVVGFNSTSWANKDKSDSSATGSGTSEFTETHDEDTSRSTRIYGNIGVTTSQQMLQSEIDLRQTDFFQIFTQEFKQQFCLLIY